MIGDFSAEMDRVFVNRTVELATLNNALNRAENGTAQVVLIQGEAGIGKTALVERFLSGIPEKNHSIKKTACKYGVTTPYASINDLVGEKEVKKKINSAAPLLGLVHSSSKKSKEDLGGERDRIFSDFVEELKKESEKNTHIIFIDNLQWIDEASAKLLSSSINRIANSHILLILAYRPEEVKKGSSPAKVVSDVKVNEIGSTITLSRLDFDESEEIIKLILKRDDIPSSFMNKVYKETEGNPLFIKELLSSLIQEGILDPTSYTRINVKDIRVPPGIKEVLMRRVSKLSPDARKVLNYAAMIGARFDFDTLWKISGMEEEKMLDIIDELLEARVIEEDTASDEEAYFFTYMQIRDLIEGSLSKSRRRILHKKIAEHLEKSNAEPYEIAENFYKGGVCDKAYEYAVAAAEKSAASFGFESSIYFYRMALSCVDKLESVSEEELLDIHAKLGDLYRALGDWDNTSKEYEKALRLAEKLENKEAIAEINLELGSVKKNTGEWDSADICFEAAKNIAKEIGNVHLLGDAERGLGYVHWRKGEYKDAVLHYTESIKYAKEANDSGMAGKVFVEMGNVYSDMGNLEKAIEYYKKSIPRLKKIKKYDEIARVLNNLGDSYMQKGDWDHAIEYFNRCEDAASRIGEVNLIAWAMFNAAEAYARKGETEKARELCSEAAESLRRMKDRIGLAATYRVCGIVDMMEENYEEAIKSLQKSVRMFKELEIQHLLGLSEIELARAMASSGDEKHALKWYEEALDIFTNLGTKKYIELVEDEMDELV